MDIIITIKSFIRRSQCKKRITEKKNDDEQNKKKPKRQLKAKAQKRNDEFLRLEN